MAPARVRLGEFIDPKREYDALVTAMGGVVLRLEPGRGVRLSPLTRIGTREMREGLLNAVTRAMLDRPLAQAEAVGLGAALGAADRHRDGGATPPKVIRTNDEGWRALPIAGLGEYYQAFKLSRATGVQHWLVLHRLSDLRAAGDEGTRQQRLVEGLLAEASTVVVYRQLPGEIATTTELLGLSSTEAEVIGALGDGQALWRVAGRSFLIQHVLSDMEWALVDTDAAMPEPDRDVLDRQAAAETEETRV